MDVACYLHPTHTAFEKFCDALTEVEEREEQEGVEKINLSTLLSSLHGFFNVSTARREEITDTAQELLDSLADFDEHLDQFFKPHVKTRWLERRPCLQRLVSIWTSIVQYFT